MRIFIVDKPQTFKFLAKCLNDDDVGIINSEHFYKFDFQSFTFLGEPVYQYYEDFAYKQINVHNKNLLPGKSLYLSQDIHTDLFLKASEVCLVMYESHTQFRARRLFQQFILSDNNNLPITYINLVNFSEQQVMKAFLSRKTYDNNPFFQEEDDYRVKDFIDYNFNGAIKTSGFDAHFITRNMVYLLLRMDKNKRYSRDGLYLLCHRYNIGSSKSINKIIEELIKNNFIDGDFKITEEALTFIDKLSDPLKSMDTYDFLLKLPFDKKLSFDEKMNHAKKHLEAFFIG